MVIAYINVDLCVCVRMYVCVCVIDPNSYQ